MKKTFLSLFCMLCCISAFAQQASIYLGDWKTIDDKTGEPSAIINIYRNSDGTYFGKIINIMREDIPTNAKCTACNGAERNKPILGMIVLKSMKLQNKELIGGNVLDPETGKTYNVKITFEKDGRLKVRGSLDKKGLLGRSQYWIR